MGEKFSVMTFNMQFGQRWDSEAPDDAPVELDATIQLLRDHPHDVILLQEVERANPGGMQSLPPPNFTRLKAALADYDSAFAYPRINPDELPFGIALAIFSKTPLRDFRAIDLPAAGVVFEFEGSARMPSHRQLLRAKTTIHGHNIDLFNTHLQAFFMINATSNEHPMQRDMVESAIRRSRGPTILTGDFNCSPEEDVVGQFGLAGFQSAQTKAVTWLRRPYVTDHIFYNAGLRKVASEVIETRCSDHLPVSATFEIVEDGTSKQTI